MCFLFTIFNLFTWYFVGFGPDEVPFYLFSGHMVTNFTCFLPSSNRQGEEDTIDKTIDSDESLCLDHVEDVIMSRKPVSPSA